MEYSEIVNAVMQRSEISVPIMQIICKISYKEAREALTKMQNCGLVSTEEQGVSFSVNKDKVVNRVFCKEEAREIYNMVTTELVRILTKIVDHPGIPLAELMREIRDEDCDVPQIVTALIKHKLIYEYNKLFFAAVNKRQCTGFSRIARTKRRYETTETEPSDEEINSLFAILIE